MAGVTYVTQTPLQVSAITTHSTVITQAVLQLGATVNFSCRMTQVVLQASTWTAYYTRITQAILQVWVMSCSSSSYVPPAATGLIVVVATGGASGSFEIDLTWTALADYTYTVKRSLTSGGAQITIATGLTVAHYEDTGRSANTNYYYIVYGMNPCGDTTTSNEASAAFTCSAPPAPLGLTEYWSAGVTALSWQPVASSTYTLYRIGPGEQSWTAIASGLTTESYSDPITVEGVYIYTVASVNGCGTMISGAVSVTVPCCTQWGNTITCDTTYQAATPCNTSYIADEGCDTSYTAGAPCGPTEYTPGADCDTTWTKEGCS